MKMTKDGRITIPKAIRERHGFSPGIEVEVNLENGIVTVRPRPDMRGEANTGARLQFHG
jgi:AbrB family looped-hinge helix DNA binding protein